MTKLVNRAKMTTATTGTGTITLGSAVDGYQTFAAAGVADADVVRYVIEDGNDWEIGTGTYTASGTTLSRTVSESSNSDAALNLSGSAVVFVTADASDIVQPSDVPAAVDAHLNTSTATSGEVLSWTGTDYDWIAAGGGTALELYAENPSSPTAPSATGTNAVAIGTNASASGSGGFASGNGATASGSNSVALGRANTASGGNAFSFGFSNTASGTYAIGIHGNATADETVAIGRNSSGQPAQAATGQGAMALGGSYASGADSLAAAIANNTSSYGATGANSVAIGDLSKATNTNAVCISNTSTASGTNSAVLGGSSGTASGSNSVAVGGSSNTASGTRSFAYGYYGNTNGITNKVSHGIGPDRQNGMYGLAIDTADATPKALATDYFSAGSLTQIILPNNSAYAFHGTIVARQQASAGTACAAWKIEGLIRREGSAGTTVLVNSATTVLDNTPGWGMALSADTTNGGLKIEVTGAAATNIRWVCTAHTSEVTY